jgi:hypothetical protein
MLEILEDRVTPSTSLDVVNLGAAVLHNPVGPVGGAFAPLVNSAANAASNLNPSDSVPVTLSVGNVTTNYSNQAQTVTFTVAATANGAPLPAGSAFVHLTDASGNQIGSPVLVSINNGSGSATFTVPAGLASGTYTITPSLLDPIPPYSGGPVISGTLTINPASSGGSSSGGSSSGDSPSSGSSSTAVPATPWQAWVSLYFDGVREALDQLLSQPLAPVQADINFLLPYAGPLGPYFEVMGELAVYQALQQHNT